MPTPISCYVLTLNSERRLAEVLRRYWVFLPSAFLAHRAAFLRKPLSLSRDMSVASLGGSKKLGDLFSEPYRNVMRMHLLLFFFFFAHFVGVENFAVYAVVYAVYFFPWRLVRRPATPTVCAFAIRTSGSVTARRWRRYGP